MAEDHDYTAHPWLVGYEKKNDKQKIDTLTEQVKYLENLIGTISVMIFGFFIVMLGLFLMLTAFGKIDIGIISSIFKLFGG
jgi:hypothetical protein